MENRKDVFDDLQKRVREAVNRIHAYSNTYGNDEQAVDFVCEVIVMRYIKEHLPELEDK